MITVYPFGNSGGFGDGQRANEYYFSRSIQRGLFGFMTGYNVAKVKDSTDITGLGSVKRVADASGYIYCVDSNGKIYKEATPGAADFGSAAVRNPGAGYGGQGLIGDQKGRLLYFGATVIGMLAADGTTWTDSWKTGLTDYDHPADTYEGMTIFGNKNTLGLIDSADSMNLSAFTLPTSVTIDACKAGKNGFLVGANLGYRGLLILWDAQASRSIAPWIWTNGKVQAIERVDTGWIVVTQKEVLLTNGYTTQKLVQLLDDPLGYSQFVVTANGVLALNNKVIILNQANGYGRQKSGASVFDLETGLFEFVPVSTNNVRTAQPLCIYASKNSTQEIFLGYTDNFLSKNYIGFLTRRPESLS